MNCEKERTMNDLDGCILGTNKEGMVLNQSDPLPKFDSVLFTTEVMGYYLLPVCLPKLPELSPFVMIDLRG